MRYINIRFLVLFIGLFICSNSFGQITIREHSRDHRNLVEISEKDSLFYDVVGNEFPQVVKKDVDGQKMTYLIDTSLYIGEKVYFYTAPEPRSSYLVRLLRYTRKEDILRNKSAWQEEYTGKEFVVQSTITAYEFSYLVIADKDDSLFLWRCGDTKDSHKYIKYSYYELVKKKYIGKKYVLSEQGYQSATSTQKDQVFEFSYFTPEIYKNFINQQNKDELVSFTRDGEWKCVDVVVANPYAPQSDFYSNKKQTTFLSLVNDKGEELCVRFAEPYDITDINNHLLDINSDFVLYDDYIKQLELDKKMYKRVKKDKKIEAEAAILAK